MKSSLFVFVFVALTFSSFTYLEEIPEKAVKRTLAGYLHAGDTNDAVALDQFMHPDFRVALYDGQEDVVKIVDRATYSTMIDNKTFGGYERTVDYHSIHFVGDHMATVQATLTSTGKPTLQNFYSLVKLDGTWSVLQDFVTLIP